MFFVDCITAVSDFDLTYNHLFTNYDIYSDIFGATTSAKVVVSKSFGLITAIIAVLIVAFLMVLTVFYLRKKYVKPKEDNVVLLAEDEKLENSESQIITTRKGSSFFVHFQPNQDSC